MNVKTNYLKSVERTYRQLVHSRLQSIRVVVQETDLHIHADNVSSDEIKGFVIQQRSYLNGYIQRYPDFIQTLQPWPTDPLSPPVVRQMIDAGQKAGVGPMAAVAGAIAEQVGYYLLKKNNDVIIENGGDVFIRSQKPLTVAVFAGHSPLSLKIGLQIDGSDEPMAVCTSSGSVGHSLSKGSADAVCILSQSCALADAVATAVGNRVLNAEDINTAIHWGRKIKGVDGILVIVKDKLGLWGKIRLKPIAVAQP